MARGPSSKKNKKGKKNGTEITLEFFENHFSKSPEALIIVFVDIVYQMYT